MVLNNTSYTLALGDYLCTVSKVNQELRYSKRYIVTGTNFLGKGIENIRKTCVELEDLMMFLRRVKNA